MNLGIDKQCSDVSRACYLSWDCNSYLNENSPIIGKDFIDKYLPVETTEIQVPQPNKPTIVQNHENQISDFEQCEIIKKNIDKSESFASGNRNHYCGLLCAGLNRIGIDSNTAYNYLVQFEQSDFTAAEIQKIVQHTYKHTNFHGCNPIPTSNPDSLNGTSKKKNHYNGESNEFPVDVFPSPFRELIEETKASLNYPVDYTGSSILAAVSTAIGKTAALQVKNAWKEYAPLYLGIVGNAGAAKSHPLDMCFKQLEIIDKENLRAYELLLNEYARYNDLPKKEKALEQEVQKPTLIKSILGNFSAEILCQRLADNKRGNCVKSEELETWLQGMNNYSKGDQASTYLSFWSCKGTSVDRVSKPIPLFVDSPYLNIIGSIQPRRIKSLFPADKCDSGFLPRFLWAFPLNADKEKISDREMNLDCLDAYNNWITNYIRLYPATNDNWGNPAPKVYTWSPDAKECWVNFQHTNTEKCKAAGESLWSEVLNKFDIHFVRLSLLLQIMNNPLSDTISLKACEGAAKLCKYFETCSKMILDRLQVESNTLSNATVAKYLVENCGISQNKTAEILGVTQPYVNKVINKK
jgi:plasmid maintenance system antidote protein VapI